ncbi:MAG TPA: O-antigen ligase family protein [Bryobacteraceae bacterium]|nr:O-antigen ligase family protein [Bryobacteraceae bacterium]
MARKRYYPAPVVAQTGRATAWTLPQETKEPEGFQNLAFYAGLAMLLVRLAVLPEVLYSILHVNTYILYLVGPPAIFGALFCGAIPRTLRHPAGWFWVLFFTFMAISVPFSSWKGGSTAEVKSYAEFSLPLLFTVGGLTLTWKQVRTTCYVMGVSGLINIFTASLFAKEDNGRIDMMASGTIGNSNDLASHLILILPFVLFIAMDKRRNAFLRWSMIAPIVYALRVILGTASRGAVIALVTMFLFVLIRASAKQRVIALVLAGLMAAAIPVLVQGNAAARLGSMIGESSHEEAKESEDARRYLLKQSLIYTLQHPVFGIGVGQFATYEGTSAVAEGRVGNWHQTHNAFTQVSSECGIPALLGFILGLAAALRSLSRTYRESRRGGFTEISNAAFCYLLAMVGYLVSIFFLANAYRFYLPAMIGLAIAMSSAAAREMSAGNKVPELASAFGSRNGLAVRI